MKHNTITLIVLLTFSIIGITRAPTIERGERHRGVSWVGSPRETTDAHYFDALLDHHINWIVQTPFGWQPTHDSPDIHLRPHGGWWGETDEGIRVTTAMARERGVKTLLKPHLWLRRSSDGKWRSDIEMDHEEAWRTWFANYRTFALHYARLAQELGIEGYCIGTELRRTVAHEAQWRALIAEIRAVYSGELTYAANWYREFEEVPFWDALDYIGIQAYFPLTEEKNPSLDELVSGWQPHLQSIRALQERTGKPIVFTEIGYRNTAGNAIEPWVWPKRPRVRRGPDGKRRYIHERHPDLDPGAQARAFQAVFTVFWNEPWFKGLYVWKWFPDLTDPDSERARIRLERESFTPQHQPAMDVIERYYAADP